MASQKARTVPGPSHATIVNTIKLSSGETSVFTGMPTLSTLVLGDRDLQLTHEAIQKVIFACGRVCL